MPVVKHSAYVANLSAAGFVRKMVSFLTTDSPVPNRMWTLEWQQDQDPTNEFPTGTIAFILSKSVKANSATDKLYAKIIYNPSEKSIKMLTSGKYSAAADNNANVTLTGSIAHNGLDELGDVIIRDNKGVALNPAGKTVGYSPQNKGLMIPTLYFANDFDVNTDRIVKSWFIRRLSPLFDEAAQAKLTDIYLWATMCTKESGGTDTTPLDQMGYYQSLGFGMCGEQLIPDASFGNGAGAYTCVTSFADKTNAVDESDSAMRVYAGGGPFPSASPTNIGCVFCAGNLEQRVPKTDVQDEDTTMTKITWFYACPAYGQARPPFDEKRFGFNDNHTVGCPDNVGFDYTELCKYSPYSGVRVLTPAYIYGMYDELYRVLGRIPVFYTQLTGLYAGDTISQEVEGLYRDYLIFPFIDYRCLSEMQAKRGHAIFVPAEETVA